MRIWGSLLAVTVLVVGTACARDVPGTPTAGDLPARETVSSPPAEETRVTECTDCPDDVINETTKHPVVTQPKQVDSPLDCDGILPLPTISQAVGANAHPGSASRDECHVVWETNDLSRIGQLFVKFKAPPRGGPADISDFEGNTLVEEEETVKDRCEYSLAINADLARSDVGSWLIVRVSTKNSNPPPCPLARDLLETAFANLADAD